MRRSLLTGRNALINLFIAAFVIFIAFNALRGSNDERTAPPQYQVADTSDELRLSNPISASEYVEVDGEQYLLLMSKHDNERIETADLRIISVDPGDDLEQAGWIHTSMSVQRPPEALTYARGHAYVGLSREGTESPALWVVDLSDPGRPFEANLLRADMPIRSLAASEDGYLVASGFENEFLIYDISRPNEPEVVGSFSENVDISPKLSLYGSTLVIEHMSGLILYDMSAPENPARIAALDHPDWQPPGFEPGPDGFLLGTEGFSVNLPVGNYLDFETEENIIALAAGEDGVVFLDGTGEGEPAELSAIRVDGRVASIALDGDLAYALSGRVVTGDRVRFTVHTIDISDPANPRETESATTISGLPRFQNVVARDGNVWILVNSTVFRYKTAER